MRLTMRVLALAGLAVFGLGLVYDIVLYLRNPCPPGFGPLAFFYFPGAVALFTVPLALIGSVLAATLATSRRQWGWLAGLLVAAGFDLLVIAGVVSGSPKSFAALPTTALASLFASALGPTCGGSSSAFAQALGMSLPLLVAPLVLLAYGYSSASGAASDTSSTSSTSSGSAESTIVARRLLWVTAIVALAFGLLLGGLRLVSYLQFADVSPFDTVPGMTSRFYGSSPFNSPLGMVAAYLISPVGVLLAFTLGVILIVLAARGRAWAWFAGLLAVELVTLLVFAVYYASQPSFYVPLLYRWPALALIAVALPLPVPLVMLAYVWWGGRQSTPANVVSPPAPAAVS